MSRVDSQQRLEVHTDPSAVVVEPISSPFTHLTDSLLNDRLLAAIENEFGIRPDRCKKIPIATVQKKNKDILGGASDDRRISLQGNLYTFTVNESDLAKGGKYELLRATNNSIKFQLPPFVNISFLSGEHQSGKVLVTLPDFTAMRSIVEYCSSKMIPPTEPPIGYPSFGVASNEEIIQGIHTNQRPIAIWDPTLSNIESADGYVAGSYTAALHDLFHCLKLATTTRQARQVVYSAALEVLQIVEGIKLLSDDGFFTLIRRSVESGDNGDLLTKVEFDSVKDDPKKAESFRQEVTEQLSRAVDCLSDLNIQTRRGGVDIILTREGLLRELFVSYTANESERVRGQIITELFSHGTTLKLEDESLSKDNLPLFRSRKEILAGLQPKRLTGSEHYIDFEEFSSQCKSGQGAWTVTNDSIKFEYESNQEPHLGRFSYTLTFDELGAPHLESHRQFRALSGMPMNSREYFFDQSEREDYFKIKIQPVVLSDTAALYLLSTIDTAPGIDKFDKRGAIEDVKYSLTERFDELFLDRDKKDIYRTVYGVPLTGFAETFLITNLRATTQYPQTQLIISAAISSVILNELSNGGTEKILELIKNLDNAYDYQAIAIATATIYKQLNINVPPVEPKAYQKLFAEEIDTALEQIYEYATLYLRIQSISQDDMRDAINETKKSTERPEIRPTIQKLFELSKRVPSDLKRLIGFHDELLKLCLNDPDILALSKELKTNLANFSREHWEDYITSYRGSMSTLVERHARSAVISSYYSKANSWL